MRVLFVSFSFPLPADNGQKLRSWSLLQAVAAQGHAVTLLCFATPDEIASYLLGRRRVEEKALSMACRSIHVVLKTSTSLTAGKDYRGHLAGLYKKIPYGVQRFRSAEMQERMAGLLAKRQVDVVVVDSCYLLGNVPPQVPIPLLLNTHNVEHRLVERFLSCSRNPAKVVYAWWEAKRLRAWEQGSCRRADVVLACSEIDREALLHLVPGKPIVSVPNVIELARYEPAPVVDEPIVLYIGGMDWYPNRDAVQFFVAHILPTLQKLVPGVRFVVAGRDGPARFRARYERLPAVTFTGTVVDMRDEIAKAAVCVVPLRIGSGTRLKILEASAMAKPIVSTRLGAEGLVFTDGKEIALQDEPQAFAKAVAALLQNRSQRVALGQAARQRVETQYSASVLAPALQRAFQQLATTMGRESAYAFGQKRAARLAPR